MLRHLFETTIRHKYLGNRHETLELLKYLLDKGYWFEHVRLTGESAHIIVCEVDPNTVADAIKMSIALLGPEHQGMITREAEKAVPSSA